MPNDDLTVGRCEALSDAQFLRPSPRDATEIVSVPPGGKGTKPPDPLTHIENGIKFYEGRVKEFNAKLDTLYALRAKLLSDPECAKAVQAALELLR